MDDSMNLCRELSRVGKRTRMNWNILLLPTKVSKNGPYKQSCQLDHEISSNCEKDRNKA